MASAITRAFNSGATPVSTTVTVNQPYNPRGKAITVGAIGAQTAFQYFNQNIAQAVSSGAASITFPAGNYTITPESGAQYHITINSASDLTIDLQGANLTFAGVQGGLSTGTVQGVVINNGARIVLKNFTVDYDVRIASSGTVQSESAHCSGTTHKYVLVNTGQYPITDTRIQQAKIINNSNSTLWGIRANEYYTYSSPLALQGGNGFYPCSAAFDSAFPTVGQTVTVRHFAYDGNAIGVYGSSSQDITLQNITLYSAPAMGIYFGSGFTRGAAIQNIKIIKNPADSTRLITLAADGIHFQESSGDLLVENSEVSFQGDDGLNIVSVLTASTTVSGTTVTLPNAEAAKFGSSSGIGQTFAFYGPSFTSLGTAVLGAATVGGSTVLTFPGLSGVSSGSWVMNQSLDTSRVYISGNSFHDNRERGLMARATGMMITGNTFSNNSGPAILLLTDGLSFNEGGFAKDVSILGNTITSANATQVTSGTYVLEFGAIGTGVECPSASGCTNTIAPSSLIQNIAIQNNSITTSAGIGMLLSNLSSAIVTGNTISDAASTVQQSSFGGAASAAGSIHSTRSTGLSLGANSVSRAATSN